MNRREMLKTTAACVSGLVASQVVAKPEEKPAESPFVLNKSQDGKAPAPRHSYRNGVGRTKFFEWEIGKFNISAVQC